MEWQPGRHVDGEFHVGHPAASLRMRVQMVGDMTKVMTVRIDDDLKHEVYAVARTDEVSASARPRFRS